LLPRNEWRNVKRTSIYFTGPQRVELREEELDAPGAGQIQVRSLVSAVSAGTEILVYKGEAPQEMAADSYISALRGSLAYPLKYGYSMAGEVIQLGEGVGDEWEGRRVFAFNPHETALNANIADVQPLPDGMAIEDAAFLANMETALSLVQDGKPLIGEKVVVLGQGIVGLLTTALLARHPLMRLVTVDGLELRRDFSRRLGAHESQHPEQIASQAGDFLREGSVDLVYELTGDPEAINLALDLVGEHGRIVVGSWYGARQAPINLGGKFHRGRIKIISSQVSQIEPTLRGRWDQARRFEQAWKWAREIKPSQLVTHRFRFAEAAEAYKLLAESLESALGVLFQY